jgi:hypothetical protein
MNDDELVVLAHDNPKDALFLASLLCVMQSMFDERASQISAFCWDSGITSVPVC